MQFNPFQLSKPSDNMVGLSLFIKPQRFRISLRSKIWLELYFIRLGGSFPERTTGESDTDFKNRLSSWLESIFQSLLMQEGMKYSNADARIIRDELTNEPLLSGLTGGRGSNNVDIIYNDRFPPSSTRFTNRQRTYESVPIAGLLYLVCQALASDGEIRDKLNVFASAGHYAPAILQELMKSNRSSRCQNFDLYPIVGNLTDSILQLLGLEKTFLDYKYLRTDAGLVATFSFFSRLNQMPGNYVKMVKLQPVILPSGETTTLNALSNETLTWSEQSKPAEVSITRVERELVSTTLLGSRETTLVPVPSMVPPYSGDTEIRLLPGHSYGENVNEVHFMDSYIMGRTLLNPDGTRFIIGQFSPSGVFDGNTLNLALYIVLRGAGEIHNSPNPPAAPNALSTDNNNAQKADAANKPQRGRNTQKGTQKDDNALGATLARFESRFGAKASGLLSRTQKQNYNGFINLLTVMLSLLRDKVLSPRLFERIILSL